MIPAVDKALEALIRRDALASSGDVDVSFEAPTTDWASRRNGPSINLYLYDIREDTQRRQLVFENVRNTDGLVVKKIPPPRRFKLSYLLTAWTQRPEDEHRLLSSCLGCLVAHDTMPEDLLTGALAGLPSSLVTVALPGSGDRQISEIWTALGGELKPSLDLQINAPFISVKEVEAAPPVMEEPSIEVRTATGVRERPSRADPARVRPRPVQRTAWAELDETVHGSGAVVTEDDVPPDGGGMWIRMR